ncbi:MAG: hypothetical protein J1F04_07250 [Oscillospiraceae bacterium]|nr:hypothetical protein [Oscillospiraceae bacterium]
MLTDKFKEWLEKQTDKFVIIDQYEYDPTPPSPKSDGSVVINFTDKKDQYIGEITVRNTGGYIDADLLHIYTEEHVWDISCSVDNDVDFTLLFKDLFDYLK